MGDKIVVDIESSGIYEIRNLINGKRYIGSATCFRKRWAGHKSGFKNGNHPNRYLMSSWIKYGPDAFVFGIIEVCAIDELIRREQYWIDSGKPEYNLSPTAGNNTGVKFSDEAKQKISERHKGNKYCLGRKISDKTKAAISQANRGRKGRKRSPSAVAATAQAHRGMKRSEETRRKISESRIGKKLKVPRSLEYRQAVSLRQKGVKKSPKHMEALQKGRAKQVFTEERKAKVSQALREAYDSGIRSRVKSEDHKNKIGQFYAKLTDDQVREIRQLKADGVTGRELAGRYGSNPGTISAICRLKRYRWVS